MFVRLRQPYAWICWTALGFCTKLFQLSLGRYLRVGILLEMMGLNMEH